jgi:pimeloyl-ACP methyl ester carboxylesterase
VAQPRHLTRLVSRRAVGLGPRALRLLGPLLRLAPREAEVNALPQFRTRLDGGGDDTVEVHLLHVRSRHREALPLLLTHGWPGSIVEFLGIVEALTDPPDPQDAFHLVIPSLPGYGLSGHAGPARRQGPDGLPLPRRRAADDLRAGRLEHDR